MALICDKLYLGHVLLILARVDYMISWSDPRPNMIDRIIILIRCLFFRNPSLKKLLS
jgi:hypothetical protein